MFRTTEASEAEGVLGGNSGTSMKVIAFLEIIGEETGVARVLDGESGRSMTSTCDGIVRDRVLDLDSDQDRDLDLVVG